MYYNIIKLRTSEVARMKNYLILLFILNVFVFIVAMLIPMNIFIKGIVLGGLFFLLIFQYVLLKIKRQ